MLLILTWDAGAMDAVSYLGLGHVFTAMMTGNTVLLGLSLSAGAVSAAFRSILALVGFALGVALAARITAARRASGGSWPAAVTAALAVEAAALGLFTLIWYAIGPGHSDGVLHALIVLSSLAMGMQSGAVRRIGVSGVTTTFITGTLTDMVTGMTGSRRRRTVAPVVVSSGQPSVLLLTCVFAAYGLGALTGGLLQTHTSIVGAAAPLLGVSVVVANAWLAARGVPVS